jgi:two-component system chemotaxis response regulator CheY
LLRFRKAAVWGGGMWGNFPTKLLCFIPFIIIIVLWRAFDNSNGKVKPPHDHIIWIVEDDLDDRSLLQEAFADTQIPSIVFIFPDAITALQKLGIARAEELPHIIVSDYNMPMMNGNEFVQALHAHGRYEEIKKVILSTSNYLFDTEKCLQNGAHAYFIKPENYPQLVDIAFSILALNK